MQLDEYFKNTYIKKHMVPQEAFYMAIGPMGKCSLETLMQNLSCHCNKKKNLPWDHRTQQKLRHPDKSAKGKCQSYGTYSFWKNEDLNKLRATVFLTSHSEI